MPLYEYECQKCGERFEVIQKFSDPLLTTHETCGGEVRKLLSAPAIQFKGSGWYVTDYARAGKNGGTADSSKSESKSSESKSESSSSESKTESKSESKSSESKSSSSGDSSTSTTTARSGDSSKK